MFSIVIPLFNKRETILRSIGSVLSQIATVKYEIIVVNDGSTDGSDKLVETMLDNRIRLYSIPNSGPSFARNYGVKQAIYDWIIFLDADDELLPHALLSFETRIEQKPKCSIFVGNHIISDGINKRVYSSNYRESVIKQPFISWFFERLMPRAGACAISREVMMKYSYDNNLWRYEDAEHLFRLMKRELFYRFPDIVMVYNTNFASASKPRNNISEDYLGHLSLKKSSFGEKLVLYELYLQAVSLYPEDVSVLYHDFERNRFLRLIYRIARRIRVELRHK